MRLYRESGILEGSILDITGIRQVKENIRQTNELLSLFIKYSPIYAYIKEVTPAESRGAGGQR